MTRGRANIKDGEQKTPESKGKRRVKFEFGKSGVGNAFSVTINRSAQLQVEFIF